jgi:hypothetical protein
VIVSFDPDALRALGGSPRRAARPATLGFLVRVGLGAGLSAAVCNVTIWLVARAAGWDLTAPQNPPVRPLAIVVVCLLVGLLAALGSYVAARVTRRPVIWVSLLGVVLTLASTSGLPTTLQAMHLVTGALIVGWLARAVVRGSHMSDR